MAISTVDATATSPAFRRTRRTSLDVHVPKRTMAFAMSAMPASICASTHPTRVTSTRRASALPKRLGATAALGGASLRVASLRGVRVASTRGVSMTVKAEAGDVAVPLRVSTDAVMIDPVVGAKRFSNYFWAGVVTTGATGFLVQAPQPPSAQPSLVPRRHRHKVLPPRPGHELLRRRRDVTGDLSLVDNQLGRRRGVQRIQQRLVFSFFRFRCTGDSYGAQSHNKPLRCTTVSLSRVRTDNPGGSPRTRTNHLPNFIPDCLPLLRLSKKPDEGIMRIFRYGFPGKNRRINLVSQLADVQALRVEISDGVNPRRVVYVRCKGKSDIPLTRIGQPMTLAEVESQAADLAKFLGVPIEGL